MQAQANFYYRFHSQRYAFPTQRFVGETERLYGILNARLAGRDFIAGTGRGKYSIADMAIWPFAHAAAVLGLELEKFPNVFNWWEKINERPAVKRALTVPSGEEWQFGYDKMRKLKEDDPIEYEKAQEPFREALDVAQKEFGYVYKSP
jgi:glutathione S-transferase